MSFYNYFFTPRLKPTAKVNVNSILMSSVTLTIAIFFMLASVKFIYDSSWMEAVIQLALAGAMLFGHWVTASTTLWRRIDWFWVSLLQALINCVTMVVMCSAVIVGVVRHSELLIPAIGVVVVTGCFGWWCVKTIHLRYLTMLIELGVAYKEGYGSLEKINSIKDC